MAPTEESETASPLRDYLDLLRLPKVFTALADVAMGFFFVRADLILLPIGRWALGLLAAASAALYLAGMTLNDVFDVELDREEQPDRPLPAGRIALASARWLGWQLLSLGIMLAGGASLLLQRLPHAGGEGFVQSWLPALVAAALAILIVLYNAGLKRTVLGPAVMGGCRALNVLLGMSVLGGPWGREHWAAAAGIGVYIAGVTWFARNDARRSDRAQLIGAALVMLAGVALVGALPWLTNDLWLLRRPRPMPPAMQPELWRWYTIIALLAGFIVARTVPAIFQPSPGPVRAAVSRSVMALIFLDAAACYAASGPLYACLIAFLVVPTLVVGWWVDGG